LIIFYVLQIGVILNEETYKKFYIDKTENRKAKFIDRFGEKYYNQSFTINGKSYESLQNILPKFLKISDFSSNTIYEKISWRFTI
jgi:hypothetical protein